MLKIQRVFRQLMLLLLIISLGNFVGLHIVDGKENLPTQSVVFPLATDDARTSDALGILDPVTGDLATVEIGLFYDDLGLLASNKGDILFRNKDGVNILHPAGNVQTLDLDPTRFVDFEWSPSSLYLAFVEYDENQLYIADLEAGSWEPVSIDIPVYGAPSWSPSGQYIAFNSTIASNAVSIIAILDIETKSTQIIESSVDTAFPRWSPNEKYILLNDKDSIYAIELEGETREFLANGYGAKWIDETTILYVQYSKREDVFEVKRLTLPTLYSETLFLTPSPPKGLRISSNSEQILYGFEHGTLSELSVICVFNLGRRTSLCFYDIPMSINGSPIWLNTEN